jgi:hypothetical protein
VSALLAMCKHIARKEGPPDLVIGAARPLRMCRHREMVFWFPSTPDSSSRSKHPRKAVFLTADREWLQDAGVISSTVDTRGLSTINTPAQRSEGQDRAGRGKAPDTVATMPTVNRDTLDARSDGSAPSGRIARAQLLGQANPERVRQGLVSLRS